MNIEEDIKILKNKAKLLNEHIKNYEESNCTGSDVYRAIKEEKEAIESVLADRERLEAKANKYDSLVKKMKEKAEEVDKDLEQMKVDNMYGRYKEYGGKSKWEKIFAQKYEIHDTLQELLEEEEV